MKPIITGACLLLLTCGSALSQSSFLRLHKANASKFTPLESLAAAENVSPSNEDDKIVKSINGIVVVPNLSDLDTNGITGLHGKIVVKGPEFLKKPGFSSALASFLGRSAGFTEIKMIQTNIIVYCRKQGHPVVDVIFEEGMPIVEGIIQVAVIEGKLASDPHITNPAPQPFYRPNFILGQVRLRKGDVIEENKLQEDISWINRNPFRDVRVGLSPYRSRDIANPSAKQEDIGEVNLDLTVHELFPFTAFAGYQNSGNRIVGEDRLLGGVSWGNVLGLDQILSYEYTTDVAFERYKGHSASYWVPLPWRHVLTLFGYYADLQPDLSIIGAGSGTNFSQKAKSAQASAQYSVPLPRWGRMTHELWGGFDYKNNNSDFSFGGVTAFKSPFDIFQWTLGYRVEMFDPWGATRLGIQGIYSPGGMDSNNGDDAFRKVRADARSQYGYGRLDFLRATKLPFTDGWQTTNLESCFTWEVRATAQFSSGALLPTEQLGVGGNSTVRGYEERVANGDEGWIISNELKTPAWSIGRLFPGEEQDDRLQFLLFFDYGATRASTPTLANTEADLASVGGGLRWWVGRNFSFRLDYGHKLRSEKQLPFQLGDQGRAHVGAELRF